MKRVYSYLLDCLQPWICAHSWIVKKGSPVFLNPVFGAFLTFSILFAGGLGSIFSDDIRDAVPFHWVWPWEPFKLALGPSVFWVASLFSALLFLFRQQATDIARGDAQREVRVAADELKAQSEKLEVLVRTMPPENFLLEFAQLYAKSDSAIDTVLGTRTAAASREDIALAIRQFLRMIALLAKAFDGERKNGRYAANIMLFRSSACITPDWTEENDEKLLFCDRSIDLQKCQGVLELMPEFSMTITGDVEPSPDAKVKKIVLPIPAKAKNAKGKLLVLPGAPMAFETCEPSGIKDVRKELCEWMQAEGDFQQFVVDEIHDYFSHHATVRSFVSIPLISSEVLCGRAEPQGCKPIGVLNIHLDQPGLLRTEGINPQMVSQVSNFNALIQPFILNLIKLLRKISDQDRLAADPLPSSVTESTS
ncbi:hypothetical protein M4951_07205 [Blastopirellula sp. J2-11]|uniref:hypothetical protein n=1 Tax=Blastopirellula sp. J2-11 TaxID=2943192 RepID=UPI0021CA70E7|nr:hypothetical protein [Blastopirellula sp. J2-11]UUO08098.1 hypothetical protein M4951_07205 [Blastopirellula sp. J2-11]